jgi:hypothetical protein
MTRQGGATKSAKHEPTQGRSVGVALATVLPLALAIAPLAVAVWAAARYTVDLPWMDEWELVPLVERSYEGTLSLRDLWMAHNEHRFLFPRLILLALVRLTRWNVYYEVAANVVLACAVAALLVRQARLTARPFARWGASWLVPAVSVLVFSLAQWENWIWGWQVAIWLNVLAVVGGVILLTQERSFGWRLGLAVLCGIVAQYSFANGIGYWVVGLFALAVRPLGSARAKGAAMAVWVVAAVAATGSYLYGYQVPEYQPPVAVFLQEPAEFARYILIYLGRPLGAPHAAMMGLLGLLCLGAAGAGVVRLRVMPARELTPYLCLSLYAILSAAVTGVGRLGFGALQALAPRYVTIANLLWASNAALLYFLGAGLLGRRGEGAQPRYRWAAAGSAWLALLIMLLASIQSSAQGLPAMAATSARLAAARAEVQSAKNPELLRVLYPDLDLLRKRIKVLQQLHLSLFREGPSGPGEDAGGAGRGETGRD